MSSLPFTRETDAVPRRFRKILTRLLVAAVAAVLAFVAIGIPLYVLPPTDAPQPADVIFILGPETPKDIALAKSMIAKGLSRNLLISVPPPIQRPLDQLLLCNSRQSFTLECFTPNPDTTQGEARMLQTLADKHGWKSATVITQTPHVTRSRLIISRCFTGDLRLTADQDPLSFQSWAQQYLYQSGAFMKAALITNTC